MFRKSIFSLIAAVALALPGTMPASAQIDSVDPDAAMQDYGESDYQSSGATTDQNETLPPDNTDTIIAADPDYVPPDTPGNESVAAEAGDVGSSPAQNETTAGNGIATDSSTTYQEDDLIAAAGGVFGDGAEGLARIIEDILEDQGEPNGYIVGREAGGAFVFGLRYGSGTLFHKVEGDQPVYWTGPSVGFDVGANGASTFVLVYNLNDTDELFQRFPAVEGDAYFVGGLTASYLRSGDKVLIPIRLGAGIRLGANIGYMKFSRNRRWLPF